MQLLVSIYFAVNVLVIFDIWIMGDHFLDESAGALQAMMNEADLNKQMVPQLYINKYYNTITFTKDNKADPCIARVINSLTEAFNSRRRLPHFLVIVLDKDIIEDADPFMMDWLRLQKLINWLMRQIDVLVKRCRLEITEKCPGAIFATDPKVIYIRMIRRVNYFPQGSKM